MGTEKWVCTRVSRFWGRAGTRTVRGFTLVELLVVIAIIALLMSILMPALARVRNQAKAVLCLSNLKQMGGAFAMYLDNNDNTYMKNWTDHGPGEFRELPHERYWIEALRPYYGDEGDARLCPVATKRGSETGAGEYNQLGGKESAWGYFTGDKCGEPATWEWVVACDYGSYGINAYVSNIEEGWNQWTYKQKDPYWRKSLMKGSAYIPLLGDHKWLDCWPDHTDAPPEYDGQPWSQCSQMGRICMDRHNGYINWVFCDYSARPVGVKELWRLKWHKFFEFELGPTKAEFNAAGDGWMKRYRDYN